MPGAITYLTNGPWAKPRLHALPGVSIGDIQTGPININSTPAINADDPQMASDAQTPPDPEVDSFPPRAPPPRLPLCKKRKATREVPLLIKVAKQMMAAKLKPTNWHSMLWSAKGRVVTERHIRPERRTRVSIIFNKLHTLQLESAVPRLKALHGRKGEPGLFMLEYPRAGVIELRDLAELKKNLTTSQLSTMSQSLVNDIVRLYDAHLPYIFDLEAMTIGTLPNARRRKSIAKAFIDKFDFRKDPQDDSIPWQALKETMVESARAGLKALMVAMKPSRNPAKPAADVDPDAAVVLLDRIYQSSYDEKRRRLICCHVFRYSEKLGKFAMYDAFSLLRWLPSRSTPSHLPPKLHTIQPSYDIVTHVLRLTDPLVGAENIKQKQLLIVRAELSIMAASLLVHLHAKTIKTGASKHLLALENNDTPDMYAGIEQFQLVKDARQRAVEAIRALHAVNGKFFHILGQFLQESTSMPWIREMDP
ncbi:hypothetical protein F4861DRAFT_540700 [Xylaria intraflava]|nr:hypothetical protein F4861DRAFT_540700 [Xylaria intraflava]